MRAGEPWSQRRRQRHDDDDHHVVLVNRGCVLKEGKGG